MPNSEFNIKMKPENFDLLEDEALNITGETRERLNEYQETSVMFPTFIKYLEKYNKKDNVYNAPIPMGYNILGYDMPILNRYCKKYKVGWDKTRQCQGVLSQVYSYDLLQHMWFWFENINDIPRLKLSTILEYMGASEEKLDGAHDALNDVKNAAEVIIRMFKMQRHMTDLREDGTRRLEMKGCMKR